MIEIRDAVERSEGKEQDFLEHQMILIRLAIISTYDDVLKPLSKYGCVVVSFLNVDLTADIQQAAAYAIENIAKSYTNRKRLVADGVIPGLQQYLDNTRADPDARHHAQKAMDYLYSYFCHSYLALFQHTPILSAPNKRKQDLTIDYLVDRSKEAKRANVLVEYSEDITLVNIDVDENAKCVKFD